MSPGTERISAPRRDRRLLPLLFFLLIGGTVAAPSPEELYRQAFSAATKGDIPATLAITLAALQRFGDSDDEWIWRLRYLRGNALVSAGKAEDAFALLQRPLPARLRGTEIEILRLKGQAYAAKNQNRTDAALPLITQAYALAKQKHPSKVAEVLLIRMSIARVNALKDGAEALRYLKRYPDPLVESSVRGQMGKKLADDDRFDEAIDILKPALEQARKHGSLAVIERFEGNLGWAYMELGDYENAGELFRTARKTALDLGQRIDQVPWIYQLGNIHLREGDLAAAEKEYRLAYELATASNHEQLPVVLASLARFELQRGRLVEAQRYAGQSAADARKRGSAEDELGALMIEARIATARKEFDKGERLLNQVIENTKSRNWTQAEARGRLAQLYERKGDFPAADEQFGQSLKIASKARKEIEDSELRLSFFNAVEELYDSYVDFQIARGRVERALEIAESSRAQTLEESLDDIDEPRDVRVVARDTGATILCYWLGGAHSYLWIITPNKIEHVVLPRKQVIERAIDAYQRDLLGPRGSLAKSGERGAALWKMLVEPASRAIAPRSHVILVPHGRLNAFNMETLVVPGKRPHYWIEDVISTTAGSLGLLTRKEGKRTAARRLLLVGNAPPPNNSFAPLRHASEELEKVARHFDRGQSVVLSGSKATPAAYRAASPERFTYLHFVAHGVASRQRPMESAVVLARDGDAYKLYARDIAKQRLEATLVTISSCHGAGTRTYAGEGLVGLGWAFLRAGADNVIASLWQVSDDQTPELMDAFYAKLVKGTDPATALRDAKLALKAKGGVLARPYYWAPFLLYGSS